MSQMQNIKCILLDIEGTICPISFVKETLFPYALTALPQVLASEWNDPDFKPYRNAFPESVNATPEDLRAHVEDLTKRDVKVAYHKNLQGYLWENGYRTGAYSMPLFPDVAPALKQWKQEGYQLAIYSSGSVFAQKLLLGHVQIDKAATGNKRKRSDYVDALDEPAVAPPAKRPATAHEANVETSHSSEDKRDDIKDADDRLESKEEDANSPSKRTEDLQYLIEAWFDTTNAGSKTESSSYERIAHELTMPTSDILFLSDNVKEVDAAATAGMKSIIVDRPGNAMLTGADKERLRVISSLNEIELVQVNTRTGSEASSSSSPAQSKVAETEVQRGARD